MKEKYFVDALIEKLSEKPYVVISREHHSHKNLDRRQDRRIDVLAYVYEKPFAFEVKSDEGDNWKGIEQTAYNKKILGVNNSYLVTGKRPTLDQIFTMLHEGIGCWYMPTPDAEPVHILEIGDTEGEVLARMYNQWKQEQIMKKRYGG